MNPDIEKGRRNVGLRAAASVAIAISLLTVPSAAKEAAGSSREAPIQPGGLVCVPPVPFEEKPCGTLGFILQDREEKLYATTAAHGYGFPSTDPKLRAYTAYDGPFPYGTSTGFGTVVIDDDTEDDAGAGTDTALILIDKDKYKFVKPSVRYWTGPTGVLAHDEGAVGETVYNYAPKNEPKEQAGRLINKTSNNFNSTLEFEERPGASGSPYLRAKYGEALGLNGNCLCGTGVFGYPTLDYVLRRFSAVYGYNLKVVTAHYRPPSTPVPAL